MWRSSSFPIVVGRSRASAWSQSGWKGSIGSRGRLVFGSARTGTGCSSLVDREERDPGEQKDGKDYAHKIAVTPFAVVKDIGESDEAQRNERGHSVAGEQNDLSGRTVEFAKLRSALDVGYPAAKGSHETFPSAAVEVGLSSAVDPACDVTEQEQHQRRVDR